MFRSQTSRAVARSKLAAPVRKLASSASQAELLSKYPVGLSVHGFAIENVQAVPEFSLVAVKLKHARTGSQHLHLASATDKNNVFSVAFKTNPPDATGVPHILEHTTLCGSYTYPVRDPFFKMLNRSLSNFMNAMTGHDYTYYPFATTNRKDYDNLMAVYLSSVFEPILSHEDFMQEGWRLEHADLADPHSPIEFKGVVYNEMKGQCSNTAYLYWIKFQEAIYPELQNSGGDPASILDLQYEDLVDFHASNYHPSNAKTFTYGTFALADHLQKLNELYANFGSRARKPDVKQSIFQTHPSQKSHDVTVSGPLDSMTSKPIEEQFKASVTWYLGNALDGNSHYELFKWKALSSLLFDGHNAPFYQELIETGFAEDFSPNTGLDQTTALLSFTVGATSLSEEKSRGLHHKLTEILKEKVVPELEKGENSSFHDRIQAILHQLELSFKKHKPDFGLGLLNSLVPSWVNGSDPFKALQVQNILNRFKEEYSANGLQMFQEMVERSLLDPSTPTFKFTMVPDANYNDALLAKEKETLESRVEQLSEEDKQMIYERSQKLLEKQQQTEDVSVLPTLTLKDIPRQGDHYDVSFSKVAGSGATIQKRVTNTNDLIYVTAKKDISFLPERLYKYLPLFSTCLTNLAGTDSTSITELETKIQQLTGGISFSASAKTDAYDLSKPKLRFILSGMALEEKSSHIYELWADILHNTRFSTDDVVIDKLNTLVKNLAQNQSNTIADRGHSYASAYSNSQLTPTKYINDLLGGVGQVQLVLEMNKKLEERGGKQGVAQNEKYIEAFDAKVASNGQQLGNVLDGVASSFEPSTISKTILNLPFQVGYASLAKLGAPYASKDGATLQVLSQLMTFRHLHSVIREANGAYGGGLNYDGLGGTLNYYSYRDPNAIKSASAFETSAQAAKGYLTEGKWDEKALQEAKLAIFQSVDAPSHISSEGAALFLDGISDDMRQERRERFLDVSLQDLQDANEKYLVNGSANVFTVLGEAKSLSADDTWTVKSF
ncbi:hypothetical protein JCM33374_g651 [Metschnikowia sp. JCM 33374]|nr:hypothetical protein JCM33374_g651 [Metschnikowia sp. JCM 33374]